MRPFGVQSGASLTLKNLTVTKGYSGIGGNYGGGVWNEGTLTVTDCTFTFNRAYNSGGAIYNAGTLTLVNTDFYDNDVSFYSGGAIWNGEGATATITRSDFLLNWAELGGAINNQGILTVTGSNFFGNRGASTGGGAISSEVYLEVRDSTFDYNTSNNNGGAIYVLGEDSEANITNSSFSNNESSNGGAIYLSGEDTVTYIFNSSVTNNESSYGGGLYLDDSLGGFDYGNYVIIQLSEFSDNEASLDGGGIYSYHGRVSIQRTTFASNSAGGNGGGINNYSAFNLDITGCTFYDNFTVGDGGGIFASQVVYGAPQMNITNSTFSDNWANDEGGGIYNDSLESLLNCTFSGNKALNGGGIWSTLAMPTKGTVIKNTIVADTQAGGNCVWEGASPTPNDGNNIDDGTTCGWGSAKGSMSNTDPQVDILDWNGGSTQTMALLPGSPAINGVDWSPPNDCPDTDQRGYTRLLGNYRDIGAFELVYVNFLPVVTRE